MTDRLVGLAQGVSVCAGIMLVSYGAHRVYPPAGFIVLGAFLLTLGLVGVLRGRPAGGGE